MEPRSSNSQRPGSSPQPKVERAETEAGPASWTSQTEAGSFNANSTITARATEFEHTNDSISRTATEALDSPCEEPQSRDPASSATDNLSGRGEKMRDVVDDLWQLAARFNETVDYTKHNWAGDGIVGLDGGHLDDISYLMSDAEGIPHHPFFSLYDHWNTHVAPLLRVTSGHITEDDNVEALDLVTEPMSTVLEGDPHRKQPVALIDNDPRTETHGLCVELMKLQERIQARLATNGDHCPISGTTTSLPNDNENPLLWFIHELYQLREKGKQMTMVLDADTEWQQLARTLTTKPNQILWVLHAFLSAYQAQTEKDKKTLEGRITDLETRSTISTRRHEAIVAAHKDAKSMFDDPTTRPLRSHIEELREVLRNQRLETTKAKEEGAYWKRKCEAISEAESAAGLDD
ncbi:uncharacterized protein F5Z01DRAFT_197724 [Emericellopsis atlantica]|uniref:Uncharacterized protein n=1 Tax=Emericellopsis atlantica TaxID=2614577 RepID=A0A9P8CW74_9HYPO|nr:uncharacterized protein F5Z01DRAFT_197724 [Emericellopsis atlantica]KAG9258466.1 hypothetical protein F5Z01DRAFT_197724 [Emericellopsis atlantica]